jgi:hypothetical protein
MKEKIMTEPMTGYFSVRRFKDGVEFSKRPFATEADTIQFSTIFAGDVPAELNPYVREIEKGDEKMQRLNIKIASHCKWYDGNNLPLPKPLENGTYSPLEGKRCKVQAYCSVLHGDPSKRQASGLWADAVKVTFDTDECPFGAPVLSADSLPSVTPAPSEIPQEPAQVPFPEGEKEMPF